MRRSIEQYEILFHLECEAIETLISETIPEIYNPMKEKGFNIKPFLMEWFSNSFIQLPPDVYFNYNRHYSLYGIYYFLKVQ